ncbi:MAG: hypothetical protein CR971_02375 [candidate division SR1 bacterium]|nr:MAG: hypothetical protein CR971_02375 [candidate division SR1 bacterium]
MPVGEKIIDVQKKSSQKIEGKEKQELPKKVDELLKLSEEKGEERGVMLGQLRLEAKNSKKLLSQELNKMPVLDMNIGDRLKKILEKLRKYRGSDFRLGEIYKDLRSNPIIIDGKEINLEALIRKVRYSPKGFIFENESGDKKIIPNGHDVIKLMQLYLETQGISVLDGNKRTLQQSIDGWVGNDTRDALLEYKSRIIQEGRVNERINNAIVYSNMDYNENKIEEDIRQYVAERGEEIKDVLPQKANINLNFSKYPDISLSSYGQKTHFNIDTGSVYFIANNGEKIEMKRDFILKRHANGELLDTEKDKESFRKVLKTINVINLFRKNIPNIFRDKEIPAHIETDITRGGSLETIEMNTSSFFDTNYAKIFTTISYVSRRIYSIFKYSIGKRKRNSNFSIRIR